MAWDTEIDEGWFRFIKGTITQTARLVLLSELDEFVNKETDVNAIRSHVYALLHEAMDDARDEVIA